MTSRLAVALPVGLLLLLAQQVVGAGQEDTPTATRARYPGTPGVEPKPDPEIVLPPDGSACLIRNAPAAQTSLATRVAWADCDGDVRMSFRLTWAPDGEHLVGARQDWYLPDHEFTVACIWPIDPAGAPDPSGAPTCFDFG